MNPLLNLFPETTKDVGDQFKGRNGKKIPVFEVPLPEVIKDFEDLIQALHDYDTAPTDALIAKIQTLIAADRLNMKARRIANYPGTLLLMANDVVKVGAHLLWRCGSPIVSNDATTYDRDVYPLGISDEHQGKDGTHFAAPKIFLESKAKWMLSAAVHPNSSTVPCEFQTSKMISDAAHSKLTIFVPLIKKMLSIFPDSPFINLHGMRAIHENVRSDSLYSNNFNRQFPRDQRKSFPLLLTIAIACNESFIPQQHSVLSELPGNVIIDGKSWPLTTEIKGTEAIFYRYSWVINTNVPARIANGGDEQRLGGPDKSLTTHIELAPIMRDQKNSPQLTQLIESIKLSLFLWVRYRSDLHHPWSLKTRYPEINANMKKYVELFTPEALGNAPVVVPQIEEPVEDPETPPISESPDLGESDADEPETPPINEEPTTPPVSVTPTPTDPTPPIIEEPPVETPPAGEEPTPPIIEEPPVETPPAGEEPTPPITEEPPVVTPSEPPVVTPSEPPVVTPPSEPPIVTPPVVEPTPVASGNCCCPLFFSLSKASAASTAPKAASGNKLTM